MIDDTQDITIYQQSEPQPLKRLTLQQQYPGAVVPTDPRSVLKFVTTASRYTGSETVNADPYCSFKTHDGKEYKQVVYLWGCLCYTKEMTNQQTGEVKPTIGVVFRLGTSEEPGDTYLSFTSVAAWSFVKRSILPLIDAGLLQMGDWSLSLPLIVRKKILPVGHTYQFELLEG